MALVGSIRPRQLIAFYCMASYTRRQTNGKRRCMEGEGGTYVRRLAATAASLRSFLSVHKVSSDGHEHSSVARVKRKPSVRECDCAFQSGAERDSFLASETRGS